MGRDIRAKMRFSPEVTFMGNERVLLRVEKVFGIPREKVSEPGSNIYGKMSQYRRALQKSFERTREKARELGSNIWGGTGNGNKIRNYVAEWSEANTPVQRRAEQG